MLMVELIARERDHKGLRALVPFQYLDAAKAERLAAAATAGERLHLAVTYRPGSNTTLEQVGFETWVTFSDGEKIDQLSRVVPLELPQVRHGRMMASPKTQQRAAVATALNPGQRAAPR